MSYPTLEKLFYQDSSSERFDRHAHLARQRLESESTFRTGIELAHGELFLAVPRELSTSSERILRRERRVSALWRGLPTVALGAFIRSLIMDEVVYSNEIEGVHSTRRQIELALEHVGAGSPQGAQTDSHTPFVEFANLYLNLTDNPVPPATLVDIRTIYDSVVADAIDPADLPGDAIFRSGPVVIENERGKVIHEGITPEPAIEAAMRQWLGLSRDERIPELYSALLCHFLFGYIHPFYDGNGRTGRYLLALHLSQPLSQPTVLSLSRVIAENKAAYYKAFDITERKLNCAEGTHFVLTMLDLIGQAQDDLIADLESKRDMINRVMAQIGNLENSHSPRAVETLFYAAQMHLFDAFRETRQNLLAEHLKASQATARRLLTSLSAENLLRKTSARPVAYQLTDQGLKTLGLA
ncbi:Fic family protein [uncultured Enorma sp.]|uniref:Fic family protein n=1 Tax=uncultured Enorma sp. TaxID=1714346 RepID=UPI0026DD6E5C|nr:Fic family protein [uncultured Enorma sp.]